MSFIIFHFSLTFNRWAFQIKDDYYYYKAQVLRFKVPECELGIRNLSCLQIKQQG
jgi:hypothetical protein